MSDREYPDSIPEGLTRDELDDTVPREVAEQLLYDLEQAVEWLHPEEAGSFDLERHRAALRRKS